MSLRILLMLGLAFSCFGARRAILIGVNDYSKDEQLRPLRWAEQDRVAVGRNAPAKTFSALSVIPSAQGQLDRLHYEFDRILLGASDGDIVYVFLSGRGVARPGANDGYILGSDALGSRPEDTGFRISRLRQMMIASSARKFVILADLCRLPSEPDRANHINRVLSGLGKVKEKVIEGVLATETGQYSDEDSNLLLGGTSGFGIFGYHLASALAGRKARTTEDLFRYIRAETIPRKQKPLLFGPASGTGQVELWAAGGIERSDLILVAALPWFRLVMPASQTVQPPAPAPVARSPFDELNVSKPAEAVAKLQALRSTLSAAQYNALVDDAAPQMAARGQATIVRYGSADMLPDDPLRINEKDFQEASEWFAAALQFLPSDRQFSSFRESLMARQKFCDAMTKGIDGKALLAVAGLPWAPQSETENALGVYFLERERNYAEAEKHFRKAREFAPGWAYPRHNLALTYIEQGNYAAAEKELGSAIDAEPNQPYLYYNLGLLQQRMNRRKDAMKNYDRAAAKYQEKADLLKERSPGWKRNFPADYDLATARASVLERNRAEVWNAKGTLLQVDRRKDQAAQSFAAAYQANEKLCAARYNHALLIEEDDPAQATALHSMNFQKCPEFHPSRLKLGDSDIKAGRFDTAEAHFRYVRDNVAGNTEALLGLARIHRARRDFVGALSELQEVVRLQTSAGSRSTAMPAVYEELARVHESAGREQQACEAYIKAADALRFGEYAGDTKPLRDRAKRCRRDSK